MSKAKNTVSIKQIKEIEKCMSESIANQNIEYTLGEKTTVNVLVKRKLNIYEMINLVESVCTSIVDGVDHIYRPEMKDYFIRLAVIDAYTNIDLPEGAEECYNIVYDTNLFEQITASEESPTIWRGQEYDREIINISQYNAMIRSIDCKIDYLLKHSKIDNAFDSLSVLLQNSTPDLSDVDIKGFINKVNSVEKLDEKTLAQALIDAKFDDTSKVVDFSQAKVKVDGAE